MNLFLKKTLDASSLFNHRKLTYLFSFLMILFVSMTNAQTKLHSYKFEGDTNDSVGSVNGVISGNASVQNGALVIASGGTLSFDGAALDLESVANNTLTLEFFFVDSTANNADWKTLYWFGTDGGSAWHGTPHFWWDEVYVDNRVAGTSIQHPVADGNLHHFVTVLSNTEYKVYMDGVMIIQKTTPRSTIGTDFAMLGQSIWGQQWVGSIYEFNIYEGELGDSGVVSNYNAFSDATLSGISTSEGNLNPTFNSSQDTYGLQVSETTNTVNLIATANSLSSSVSGDGEITLVNGAATASIVVTAASGDIQTYTVNISSASSDATLSDIKVGGTSIPNLTSTQTTYYYSLEDGETSVPTITVTENDSNASSVVSNSTSLGGASTIVVTAEDGLTTRTYKVYFNTKKHAYTFDGNVNDTLGGVNAQIEGTAATANGALVLDANGDYISFDGTQLALNTYDAVTMELFFQDDEIPNDWSWTAYFGANAEVDYFSFSAGMFSDLVRTRSTGTGDADYDTTDANDGINLIDGNLHHVVTVLTDTYLKLFVDGIERASKTYSGGISIDSSVDSQNYLGKGSDEWNNITWQGEIHEFNIYKGALGPNEILSNFQSFKMDQSISFGALEDKSTNDTSVSLTATTSSGLAVSYTSSNTDVATVSGSTLIIVGTGSTTITASQAGDADYNAAVDVSQSLSVINLSTDATLSDLQLDGATIEGFSSSTYVYNIAVDKNTTSVVISPTLNDSAATLTSGGGTLTLTDGYVSDTITVTAESGLVKTYTVNIKEENFEQLYADKTNLIVDPTFTDISNYGSWNPGGISINTDLDYTYGGLTSGKFTAWSVIANNMTVTPNTTYRCKAMIYALNTNTQIGISGTDGLWTASENDLGQWVEADFLFTTSDTTTNMDIFVLSSEAYIDNWEVYAVDNTVDLSTLTSDIGALTPSFDPSITSYGIQIPSTTTEVILNATVSSSTSTISGTGTIAIQNEVESVSIVVTAESGFTKTYNIDLSSKAADATLSEISIDGVAVEDFDSNSYNYYFTLDDNVTTIPTITATANDANATSVTVSDTTAVDGYTSIVVTAENGFTKKTYKVFFSSKQHAYSFDTDLSDSISGLIPTSVGSPTISNGALNLESNGQYLSFDGPSLNLASYEAISMELFFQDTSIPDQYSWTGYFGANAEQNYFNFSAGMWTDELWVKSTNSGSSKLDGVTISDGNLHHVMVVLTADSVKYYFDGVEKISKSYSGGISIDSSENSQNYLGKGSDQWNDITWQGTIHEFNIYKGAVGEKQALANFNNFKANQTITFNEIATKNVDSSNFFLIASASSNLDLSITSSNENVATVSGKYVSIIGSGTTTITVSQAGNDQFNAATPLSRQLIVNDLNLSALTVSEGSLMPSFDKSVTSYAVTIPKGTASVDVNATLSYTNSSLSGEGTIVLNNGVATADLVVTGLDGTSSKTYTVQLKEETYEQLYPNKTNLIVDPTFTDISNYGSWAPANISINTDVDFTYSGAQSGKISAWSVIGQGLSLKANTTYRCKAFVYPIALPTNIGIDGGDVMFESTTDDLGQWKEVDFTFTTPDSNSYTGIYFISNQAYIDNWELYELDGDTTLSSLSSSVGQLSPNFDPSITNYEIRVDYETTSLTLTASATLSSSSISGTTELSLVEAEGLSVFTVTAEDGSSQTYTVTVKETDTDSDGIGNNADTDDDGDTWEDAVELVEGSDPLDASSMPVDTDDDHIGNVTDTDDDNDTYLDDNDAFPLDVAEWVDTDSDGIGNNADTDDDGDGALDTQDMFPLDSSEYIDNDGDGIGNNADMDDDNDGLLDIDEVIAETNPLVADTDNDGVLDSTEVSDKTDPLDSCSLVIAHQTESSGILNWDSLDCDNDGVANGNEITNSPGDRSEIMYAYDLDGDGIPNYMDTDDDGDGIPTSDELVLNTATGINDPMNSDGDTLPNYLDTDDDNDGVPTANELDFGDSDNDGIANYLDTDDDGDGIPTVVELSMMDTATFQDFDSDGDGVPNYIDNDDNYNFEFDSSIDVDTYLTLDTDGDGILNMIDLDDDNDGFSDIMELSCNTNPLRIESQPLDYDNDGLSDCIDDDIDGDGIANLNDAFPENPFESVDTDGDGIGNNIDADDDNDGVIDALDAFPLDSNEVADVDLDGIGDNADTDLFNDGFDDRTIEVSGFLTPNSSGVESKWVITNINLHPINRVNVYDKNGSEVFSTTNYQNEWSGTFRNTNDLLPSGSYYYKIRLFDTNELISGWLYILY